ncbi:PDZ domain-containing protein [Sphingobacterium bambusae]|uniref:PDZ domain-containing protein n=1 Tax=Sphingobacterium bambusae TaxID=662858 RepID=A0ABW6BJU3_9SPHI|nr:PDZ domain-containing protein [Sphingobacterium bambusae]WPL48917.1 PDZ domain-containing protein [Sphingobacterium bambusae]
MKWYHYLILICIPYSLYGQGIFRLKENKPVTVKFDLINNVVLVPLTINGITFSFLLDTGVKETILFAQANDSLYLNNKNKMKFHGIGLEDGIEGILSTGNVVELGAGAVIDSLHWLYVIQATELDISTDVGVAINGILGSKFFQSFSVRMDYIRQRMTIYPRGYDYSKAFGKYKKLPIQIEHDRPYVQAALGNDGNWVEGKMLLDMGNTDPMMLFSFLLPGFMLRKPFVEEYIGRGFNGEIHGKRNRVARVVLGDFELKFPIVAYPDSNAVFMSKLTKNRIGSVGNQVLQRFDMLLDYERELWYLKKNKNFNKPFLLNMAGMDIKHDGMIWAKELVKIPARAKNNHGLQAEDQGVTINLANNDLQYKFVLRPTYRVSGIRKDAPAARAGVQVNDVLLKVNGTSVSQLTLAKIMAKLQSKPGEFIRLVIERDGVLRDIRFQLIDPIPLAE